MTTVKPPSLPEGQLAFSVLFVYQYVINRLSLLKKQNLSSTFGTRAATTASLIQAGKGLSLSDFMTWPSVDIAHTVTNHPGSFIP